MIDDSALKELCDESLNLEEEQRLDDKEHLEYRVRRQKRAARRKELKAEILAHMSDRDLDSWDAGDRVFTRDAKPTIKVTKRLIKSFLGDDAYSEYTDCVANINYDERVRVNKKRRP